MTPRAVTSDRIGCRAAGRPRRARASRKRRPFDTVRMITGFPPGGTSDTICRRVASKLAPGYGKSVVVENRVGAGGQIADPELQDAAARRRVDPADADVDAGHLSATSTRSCSTTRRPTWCRCRWVRRSTSASRSGPAVPASVRNIPEFLDWCKANPAQANFGSPGAGAVPHFIGVLIGRSAGIDLKHVPYRGTQPAILEMIGGQIQAVSGPVGEFIQHVAAASAGCWPPPARSAASSRRPCPRWSSRG